MAALLENNSHTKTTLWVMLQQNYNYAITLKAVAIHTVTYAKIKILFVLLRTLTFKIYLYGHIQIASTCSIGYLYGYANQHL